MGLILLINSITIFYFFTHLAKTMPVLRSVWPEESVLVVLPPLNGLNSLWHSILLVILLTV